MKFFPNKLTTPPVVEIAPGVRGGFPFREPETNAPFAFNTWHELIGAVFRHRQAHALDTSDGWHLRFEDEWCRQNPHVQCESDEKPENYETPLAVAGRALWLELHPYTESYPDSPTEDDKSRARYFLANWRERIPQFGGCHCREEWARLIANYPPDLSSREAFVTWGRVAHSAISRKIGRPIFYPELLEAANLGGF